KRSETNATECTPGYCTDNNADPTTGIRYPSHNVPAYITFDLYAGYTLKWMLGATTLGIGVHNVGDAIPPPVYNSFVSYADPGYDFAGRFVYARLAQKF